MRNAFAIALVDRRELAQRDWTSVLSLRERTEAASYSNVGRRERTIASRVMAKYLITSRESVTFGQPSLKEIEAAGTGEWPSVELLSGTARTRTGPRVFRHGNAYTDWSVSSSHSGPYTASMIARGYAGVDLERVASRRREFYSNMFSAEEQGWVERVTAAGWILNDAAFTLLWTVKEAFLKAKGRCDLSVWNFSRWTVRLDHGIEFALASREFSWSGQATVFNREVSQSVEVAVRRVNEMILTAVRYTDTVVARHAMDGCER